MTAKHWTGSWTDWAFLRRWSGSAWVDVTFARRWNGSAWVGFFPFLSASKSGGAGEAFINDPPSNSPATRNITTSAVTITATGGSESYTYAWSRVSGDTFTVNSPTAATTTFTATVPLNSILEAVYRCTVSDTSGATFTVDVSVSAAYESGF